MRQLRVIDAVSMAQKLVRLHLGIQPGEQVLLVTDPLTEMEMAWALAGAIQDVGAEYTLTVMPSRHMERATELTKILDAGLQAADVIIGMNGSSGAPTYSKTVAELLAQKRIRAMSMVMRSMDNWTRGGALADYEELNRKGHELADVWAAGSTVTVRTALGTDFTAGVTKDPVMGHPVIVECGIAREPGKEAAFSDGEISQRPLAGTANGTLVIDGPVAKIGGGDDPIHIEVRSGKVVSVEGGRRARQLQRILDTVPGADHIAEIGLGLNPMSLRNNDFEEEKKAAGSVHVALGSDLFYGGTHACDVHLDMVMRDATFMVDDKIIAENGRVVA